MGVVYLGRDPRLQRLVAIKGLAPTICGDPAYIGRLLREARMLASTPHLNIVTIYGLEQVGEQLFLIMEHAPGPDLCQRLASSPLTMNESIGICAQIAAAVEAAHRAGVVHRDLKPANVKIGPPPPTEGSVKVLDFGLARSSLERPPAVSGTGQSSPATGGPLTMEGTVLGTPGYMSPEQARGLGSDQRSDIFAFGCILFECLTGKRAFAGPTSMDAITATLVAEPEWSWLPTPMPGRLRDLLESALRKDRDDRLADISPLRQELEAIISIRRTIACAAPGGGAANLHVLTERRPMPRPATSFVGRKSELDRLGRLMSSQRLVTVLGSSGAGKSRLALEVLR